MPFAQARAMIQETAIKIHVTRKRKTSFFLLSRVEQVNFINYISYLYEIKLHGMITYTVPFAI